VTPAVWRFIGTPEGVPFLSEFVGGLKVAFPSACLLAA
jgi:hypothetical protein